MVIGIDASRANKEQKTGVEWYSYHLIRALAKINTKHTLRLYFRSSPVQGLVNLGSRVEYRILNWPITYLWTQLRLSAAMIADPPDLLFIPAQIIPLIHPKRTVTTIHDVAFKPYPHSYSIQSRFYLNLAAVLASRLPLALTVSEFSKNEIIKYFGMRDDRLVVTPLGFEHRDREAVPMILTKHGIKNPYLLSIGRLERKKNTRVLVEAFNLVKQQSWGARIQLVLVGIKGHGWGEIERVIARSDYRDDIKLVGWVTEEEKDTLLRSAAVFVLISAYEGFGLPLLEAMNTGTPIVISDQAALPEIAGDAALTVQRGNTDAICAAIGSLITDNNLRADLQRKGRERLRLFSWEQTARQTLTVFDRLLTR